MGFRGRISLLIAIVSALLPLSIWLLVGGIDGGEPLRVLIGVASSALGLFGLVALSRAIVLLERDKERQ